MSSGNLTNTAKKSYEKLLTQKVWTKQDIQRMTKALNSMRFADPNSERVQYLKNWLERFESTEREIKITADHSKQGINYWRQYCFCANGTLRKQAHNLGDLELTVIRNFKTFRFVGFHVEYNGYGMPWYHLVYRTIAKNGAYFDYAPIHWGTPLILNAGRIEGGK